MAALKIDWSQCSSLIRYFRWIIAAWPWSKISIDITILLFLRKELASSSYADSMIINQPLPCHVTFGKDEKRETKVIFIILIFTTPLRSDRLWKLQTQLLTLNSEITVLVDPKEAWPPARRSSICPRRHSTAGLTVLYLTWNNWMEFPTVHPLFYGGQQLPWLPILPVTCSSKRWPLMLE